MVRIAGLVGGKPVVRGTRIPVELVLQYLAYNPDVKTLFEAFPRLTLEDVKVCLAYAQELVEEEEVFPIIPEKQEQHRHASV